MPVYQHWDPLKKCIVGKSYPPEFYSWIKNSKARNAMEQIAIETEEDYKSLVKILESFNVDVIRPEVSGEYESYFYSPINRYATPPMTPRDYTGTFGSSVYIDKDPPYIRSYIHKFYTNVKDASWPDITTIDELNNLPPEILNELNNDYNLEHEIQISKNVDLVNQAKDIIYDTLISNNIIPHKHDNIHCQPIIDTASICRVGKDLYYPGNHSHPKSIINEVLGKEYRINFYDGHGHADSCFCPVVPGLIISLKDFQNYSETFPGWEVIELPGQSWNKVKPFLELKAKNNGKWWVPGEEGNDALTEAVETWLDNWVGYVEETVFDVNMLVINEQNVIVNNYNKKVFDALERYGVTPHICNFRHRYFWDGGIHCITADLDREGEMTDYFPERGEY